MMKRVVSPRKIIKFVLMIIIVILVIFIITFLIKTLKKEKNLEPQITVIDKLENYGYQLTENETEYYKKLFNDLKIVLNEEIVDEKQYAKLISQLFITDFFNLDNKVTKNDVGGTEFIYSEFISDFEKYAKDSIYKLVESNVYKDRKQDLPVVTRVSVDEIKQNKFKHLDKEYDNAYYVSVSIEYEKDLGYPKKSNIVIIQSDNKLEIAKMD